MPWKLSRFSLWQNWRQSMVQTISGNVDGFQITFQGRESETPQDPAYLTIFIIHYLLFTLSCM